MAECVVSIGQILFVSCLSNFPLLLVIISHHFYEILMMWSISWVCSSPMLYVLLYSGLMLLHILSFFILRALIKVEFSCSSRRIQESVIPNNWIIRNSCFCENTYFTFFTYFCIFIFFMREARVFVGFSSGFLRTFLGLFRCLFHIILIYVPK